MLRCGQAPAGYIHMHEVELLPLGDTDVTTLGKWLSNHDNMAWCCILLWKALGWLALYASKTGTFPGQGVLSVQVMASSQKWQRAVHASFHLAPFACSGDWWAACDLSGWASHSGAMNESEKAREAGKYSHQSWGQRFDLCQFLSHLNQVPLTLG